MRFRIVICLILGLASLAGTAIAQDPPGGGSTTRPASPAPLIETIVVNNDSPRLGETITVTYTFTAVGKLINPAPEVRYGILEMSSTKPVHIETNRGVELADGRRLHRLRITPEPFLASGAPLPRQVRLVLSVGGVNKDIPLTLRPVTDPLPPEPAPLASVPEEPMVPVDPLPPLPEDPPARGPAPTPAAPLPAGAGKEDGAAPAGGAGGGDQVPAAPAPVTSANHAPTDLEWDIDPPGLVSGQPFVVLWGVQEEDVGDSHTARLQVQNLAGWDDIVVSSVVGNTLTCVAPVNTSNQPLTVKLRLTVSDQTGASISGIRSVPVGPDGVAPAPAPAPTAHVPATPAARSSSLRSAVPLDLPEQDLDKTDLMPEYRHVYDPETNRYRLERVPPSSSAPPRR